MSLSRYTYYNNSLFKYTVIIIKLYKKHIKLLHSSIIIKEPFYILFVVFNVVQIFYLKCSPNPILYIFHNANQKKQTVY